MIKLPISTYGMKILRKITKPVENIDINVVELVNNMFFTMKNAEGIGLAAPQVNENLSIALIDLSPIEKYKEFKSVAMINPVIIEKYGEVEIDEGCLSIPEIRGKIIRPEKILVKYIDLEEKEIELEADEMFARVIQHEIDHLKGILFTDYLSEEEKQKIKTKLSDIRKGKILTDYPLLINSQKLEEPN
jgi:peptide deformylase